MIQITDCRVVMNNKDVAFMPNTFMYTEGLGEQKTSAISSGGGSTEQLFADDMTTHFSRFKFDIPVTVDTVKVAREWKIGKNRNACQVVAENDEGNVLKSFSKAALLTDYEVAFGTDTVISLEFRSDPAV